LTTTRQPEGLPIRADAVVLENICEGGHNYRLVVDVLGWPGAEPGQFVMLSAGARTHVERSDPLLPRPMAVYRGHAAAQGDHGAKVEILYKATGRGTQLMAETLPGQRIRLVGPLGRPFPSIAPGSMAVLVGGGTGIASLYELAARAAGTARLCVILGARSADDLMGQADFTGLDVELRITTEDGSHGARGRVTDLLGPLLETSGEAGDLVVFACGPTPMMEACAKQAAAAGAPCFVSLENNMACGFGVCLGCAVPMESGGFSLVCREGPVYSADVVHWAGLP
jgi:dihydroorotate dehydrogenase electron transfer subunit